MTPCAAGWYLDARAMLAEFYSVPENRRRFEEWMKEKGAPKPASKTRARRPASGTGR